MEIPNNNLPIYLQQYDIHIVDGETDEPKGNIQYSTVGAIPSNQIQRRVWNLNLTGKLDPNADIYKIVYDFSNVNLKERVTFENDLSGTFRICGRVMDASKIMTYEYSEKDSKQIIDALSKELNSVKSKFQNNAKKKDKEFSLDL